MPYACYELPLLSPVCRRCGRIDSRCFCPGTFTPGENCYGRPVLVGVAPTAAIAEAWRDEPAEGVRREISPVAVIDGERLAAGIRRLETPPTRIEDRP